MLSVGDGSEGVPLAVACGLASTDLHTGPAMKVFAYCLCVTEQLNYAALLKFKILISWPFSRSSLAVLRSDLAMLPSMI
jgi:hypothetical protein